jgi:hypothetical protein
VTSEALPNFQWVADLKGALTVTVLAEFLDLCESLSNIFLHHGCKISTHGGLTPPDLTLLARPSVL